ncbi:Vomeronasal type-2 receptor 26 [Tupaia chinensis]|uniref:Vomeronasal type-2 receptor 26 n=1 Tax=Tupaia chinensis TaxID=246437 RepID=L9LC72_TUPCH|nr:Vomeronasal type-2 receptor 26 [Tupaia chinensis]
MENTLFLLSGMNQTLPNYNCQTQKQFVAIIAEYTPIFSAQIGTLLELYKSPQVTYGPLDPILSNKDQFSSVYQMATKENFLAHGIIWLLLKFGWTWVALYVSDDIQGEHFLQDLKAEMIKTDAEQCIQCGAQEYPNDERTHCLPKPVTYLDFKDALGLSMTCTALWFSVVTAVILGVFVKHRDTPIVKANNQTLSFILLISLFLCFTSSLLLIGHPNTVTCIFQQVTFGLVFTVAVSTVLAKTITVILAFKAMKPGRTMRCLLLSGASNSVIPICFLIQLIICGIWLGTSPPFVDTDSHSEPRNLIIMCNKGSLFGFPGQEPA